MAGEYIYATSATAYIAGRPIPAREFAMHGFTPIVADYISCAGGELYDLANYRLGGDYAVLVEPKTDAHSDFYAALHSGKIKGVIAYACYLRKGAQSHFVGYCYLYHRKMYGEFARDYAYSQASDYQKWSGDDLCDFLKYVENNILG